MGDTETIGTLKTLLFEATVPVTVLCLPQGRETEGSHRSAALFCMWAGSHKYNTVLYFPLTYIKWFYGRKRQKGFRECAEKVRAASGSPGAGKWLGARLRERLWMLLLIFCHTFLICPAQRNICRGLSRIKTVTGDRCRPSPTWTFTVNDLPLEPSSATLFNKIKR